MNKKIVIIAAAAAALVLLFALLFIGRNKGPAPEDKTAGTSIAALLGQAKAMEAKGDLLAAKDTYEKLISDHFASAQVMDWQKKVEDLNIKLLFSPVVTAGSILYEIKPGDSLTKIAAEHKTTVELIAKSNNISGDRIIPSRKIKVWNKPFNILVDKSQNMLILKADEEVIKTYVVSTGKDNSTPVGTFKIVNKLLNPTWFKAGAVVPATSPQNILGSRWLGLNVSGYGIHGTSEPQNLGMQVTQGCVRMANPEVEELYAIIPIGTQVTIAD